MRDIMLFVLIVCLCTCCISYSESTGTIAESAHSNSTTQQVHKPTDEEAVLQLILADALRAQHNRIVEHFTLERKISTVAFINEETVKWPKAVAKLQLYDNTELLFNDRGRYQWPIVGIRLDKLDLKAQPGFYGNCRVTLVIIDSDDFPMRVLSLGYGAEKSGDSWKVELVCIEG